MSGAPHAMLGRTIAEAKKHARCNGYTLWIYEMTKKKKRDLVEKYNRENGDFICRAVVSGGIVLRMEP